MNIVMGVSWVLVAFLLGLVRGQSTDVQDARLVDTIWGEYSGRVEVYNEGQWYGICGGLGWTYDDAKMVCSMLFPEDSRQDDNVVRGYSVQYTSMDKTVPIITCHYHMVEEITLHDCPGARFIPMIICKDNTRAAVSCVGDKKKEMDLKDDLKIRAAQLLLQLLKAKM